MKQPLITMLQIYGTLDQWVDWMNAKIIDPNKLTFHHIVEKRNGGTRTIDNGAILLRSSHDFLNYLDIYYHTYYKDLNGLFLDLNRTLAPPTKEYFDEVDRILIKAKELPKRR